MQHLAAGELMKSVANIENVTQHLPREESTVRNVIHASVTRYLWATKLSSVSNSAISSQSVTDFMH